jgi:hypothetical protein
MRGLKTWVADPFNHSTTGEQILESLELGESQGAAKQSGEEGFHH